MNDDVVIKTTVCPRVKKIPLLTAAIFIKKILQKISFFTELPFQIKKYTKSSAQ